MLPTGSVEVQEALDAALNAEGSREPSRGRGGIQPNQHKRETVRRLLLRFLDECPDDLTVMDLREALDA
jgi:hypothetical protein